MADLTTEQFAAIKAHGNACQRGPRADAAHYDDGRNRVIIRMTTRIAMGFAPRDEGLQHASNDDLKIIEVEASGRGIHFPTIDADLYVQPCWKACLGQNAGLPRNPGAGRPRRVKTAT